MPNLQGYYYDLTVNVLCHIGHTLSWADTSRSCVHIISSHLILCNSLMIILSVGHSLTLILNSIFYLTVSQADFNSTLSIPLLESSRHSSRWRPLQLLLRCPAPCTQSVLCCPETANNHLRTSCLRSHRGILYQHPHCLPCCVALSVSLWCASKGHKCPSECFDEWETGIVRCQSSQSATFARFAQLTQFTNTSFDSTSSHWRCLFSLLRLSLPSSLAS